MVFTAKEIGRFELCSLTNLWAFRLFTFRCIILQLFVSDYLVQMHANYSIDAAEVCAKGKQTNEGSPNILVSLSLREINHNQQSTGSKHIYYDIQCFREFRLQPIQFLKKKKKVLSRNIAPILWPTKSSILCNIIVYVHFFIINNWLHFIGHWQIFLMCQYIFLKENSLIF